MGLIQGQRGAYLAKKTKRLRWLGQAYMHRLLYYWGGVVDTLNTTLGILAGSQKLIV